MKHHVLALTFLALATSSCTAPTLGADAGPDVMDASVLVSDASRDSSNTLDATSPIEDVLSPSDVHRLDAHTPEADAFADPDAGPVVSDACRAVLDELGEMVVDDAGFVPDYLGRASECGVRLAAFADRSTKAPRQVGWRFGEDLTGRYLLGDSRVVATADVLLVALVDTTPAEALASVPVEADDEVFCQRVSYALSWPEVGGGAFADLAAVPTTHAEVPDADVATRCLHGRVHRIDVEPLADVAGNLTPFGELTEGAGGGRLWARSVLVPRTEATSGFAIAIATRLLRAGTTPRLSLGGARSMISGVCRDVNLIVGFPYEVGAPPTGASWSVGGAIDPILCRGRSTEVAVSGGYLVVE